MNDDSLVPDLAKYCPVCGRDIVPELCFESLLWVHDDIVHADSDIAAMDNGIQ